MSDNGRGISTQKARIGPAVEATPLLLKYFPSLGQSTKAKEDADPAG